METIEITESVKESYEVTKEPSEFENFREKYADKTNKQLVQMLFSKTRLCKIFIQRWENAKEVIDLVAEQIDMTESGRYIYSTLDGKSCLVDKLQEYFSRSGEKVKLKKRLDELEKENAVLRSLIGK